MTIAGLNVCLRTLYTQFNDNTDNKCEWSGPSVAAIGFVIKRKFCVLLAICKAMQL